MKTPQDPRHKKRIDIFKQLFSHTFLPQNRVLAQTAAIKELLPQIDTHIEKAAPQWPLAKVAKVDLAILRLAVYELLYETTTPQKVIIDEAVELAKEFGGDTSSSFVNGVLGTIVTGLNKQV